MTFHQDGSSSIVPPAWVLLLEQSHHIYHIQCGLPTGRPGPDMMYYQIIGPHIPQRDPLGAVQLALNAISYVPSNPTARNRVGPSYNTQASKQTLCPVFDGDIFSSRCKACMMLDIDCTSMTSPRALTHPPTDPPIHCLSVTQVLALFANGRIAVARLHWRLPNRHV